MSASDSLIEQLRDHSSVLLKMDENEYHGLMTTIRFEEIDLIGQACVRLSELELARAAANAKLAVVSSANDKLNAEILALQAKLAALEKGGN